MLLGIGVFLFMVVQLGLDNLIAQLNKIGLWFLFIIVLSLAWQCLHALSWKLILDVKNYPVNFITLLRLKFTSDAINMLVPSANLGGDAIRGYLLQKSIPLTYATSSIVVDKTLDYIAKLIFMVLGLTLTLIFVPLPKYWAEIAIVFLLILFVFNGFLVFVQIRGLLNSSLKLVKFIPPLRKYLERRTNKIQLLDEDIKKSYLQNPRIILQGSLLHLSARVLGVFEIWLILWLLETDLHFVESVFISSLTNIANTAFFIIPGQWGVAEGAQFFLIKFIGGSKVIGLSLGVIRRIRRLIFTGLGLITFWLNSREKIVNQETAKG